MVQGIISHIWGMQRRRWGLGWGTAKLSRADVSLRSPRGSEAPGECCMGHDSVRGVMRRTGQRPGFVARERSMSQLEVLTMGISWG
jgi:hypothetical protein